MQGVEKEIKCSLYFIRNEQYRHAFIFFALKCELLIRFQQPESSAQINTEIIALTIVKSINGLLGM